MRSVNETNWFLSSKYAIYVTWAYEGENGACGCYPDGQLPRTLDEMANAFDAKRFAEDCAAFGVQYVNFTAYHAHLYILYPSQVIEHYMPGHAASRDVIRELIDELHKHDIKLQLYIHATIGDTMTAEEHELLGWHDAAGGYRRWNDFINAFFEELCARYGTEIDSYYLDMIFHEPFLERIDQPRLLRTLTQHHPEVVVVGNGQAVEGVHYGSREDAMANVSDADDRQAYPTQTVVTLTGTWWSTQQTDSPIVARYTPDHLFRYLVLTASANTEGGGLAIGASPYVTMGFEPGVRETLLALGALIQPYAKSILNTLPSKAYVTPAGMQIKRLPSGFVATRSLDGSEEYIHVLTPPAGNTIRLPVPLDGSSYTSARMLLSGKEAELSQDASGVILSIPEAWDHLDTVIVLLRDPSVPGKQAAGRPLPQDTITITGGNHLDGHGPECLLDGDESTYWCTSEGITHTITLDLGREYEVCALRVMPRQEQSVESLVTHVTTYSIWAGTDPDHLRPVATGEWKRSYEEKHSAFSPITARYIQLQAGPEWLPSDWRVFPRSAASAASLTVEVSD
ncbi:hypothetical protein PA598K_00025 [Paenibacillus sp. 598K]|uniref:alpha-L-fucosidase n=1 Tax=Paenibacillus sp. 598K TaxID=1117987 RepID=UPI000FFA182D|nr:alpha-L-fucosidase [Paenibacillus sp. 598K]GBF71813.1 hypothetical protein PA598K_00025 [Paenibacillus sp. 598K]